LKSPISGICHEENAPGSSLSGAGRQNYLPGQRGIYRTNPQEQKRGIGNY
jgi:hypothetical protein